MPDRLYAGRNHPPKVIDRVLAHWIELVLALNGILRGVLNLVGARLNFIAPPVDELDPPYNLIISSLLLVGGSLWIFSILRTFKSANRYWYTMRWGSSLQAMGWLSYFLISIVLRPNATNIWASSLAMGVMCLGAWLITFRNERVLREVPDRCFPKK